MLDGITAHVSQRLMLSAAANEEQFFEDEDDLTTSLKKIEGS